jgi:hypothetical protein
MTDEAREPQRESDGRWLRRLHGLAQGWLEGGNVINLMPTGQTRSYVDLIFAFGLARLGESDASRELLERAQAVLAGLGEAHRVLLAAYGYRIKQALEGKPHTGPLPAQDLEYLEHMDRLQRFAVDRLRKHARILEPDQKIDPYRHWGARVSHFERALAELTDLTDRQQLAERVRQLLDTVPAGAKKAEQWVRVLRAGLQAAPRVGEDFAREMLDRALPAFDTLPETRELSVLAERSAFLETALTVAAHFGLKEYVRLLAERFDRTLAKWRGPEALEAMNSLAAECFRGLCKLGLCEELDQLLCRTAGLVLRGKNVQVVDWMAAEYGPASLRMLLRVAEGWYAFGWDGLADPVLQAARTLLFRGDLRMLLRGAPRKGGGSRDDLAGAELAGAYAGAVARGPWEVARERLEELFHRLQGIRDTFTTNSHYSVAQLEVVEAVVLAVLDARLPLRADAPVALTASP